ncbi:chord-domain-containing protein [Gymnopilus junonius]|uniref:Chord-domain-containing protein n=1 Tax=Gymnopilus junonius TaxID=109634 RepID=A0A9P5NJ68_GYMJU|nr:chord-domain-containing protein [Gymnopilus junonius]
MPRCTRKGCGKDYQHGELSLCTYHPGAPVFHEGLKSWSCCQDTNKPVLDFEEFMQIEGCTEIQGHTTEAQAVPSEKPTQPAKLSAHTSTDGTEVFKIDTPAAPVSSSQLQSAEQPVVPTPVLEIDDVNRPVAVGTPCRRNGCQMKFVSDEVNRQGNGKGTICRHHPLPPIFREGSKGYLCCKRRVLEFEEFLKIEGCQTGRHCFVPIAAETKAEEQVECRIDHYQTPGQVHVSVFAKSFEQVILNLALPNNKRFSRTLELFGEIKPDRSSFNIFGTKVELHLQKSDTRSWAVLEKNQYLGNVSLTFGVSGRTGTIGGKEVILDESNKLRSL